MKLATKRLFIRPFVKEDITEEYIGWLNDKDLMQYSRQRHRTHNYDSCLNYLSSFAGTTNSFLNVLDRTGKQVGTLTVYRSGNRADIGILMGAHGKGYGSEAFGATLANLFDQGAEEVSAGTHVDNEAMVKIAANWRMRLVETNGYVYRFTISKDEWAHSGRGDLACLT